MPLINWDDTPSNGDFIYLKLVIPDLNDIIGSPPTFYSNIGGIYSNIPMTCVDSPPDPIENCYVHHPTTNTTFVIAADGLLSQTDGICNPTVTDTYFVQATWNDPVAVPPDWTFTCLSSDPICYIDNSKVLVETDEGITIEKLAKDIYTGDKVFSFTRNKFVPVRLNIVSGPTTSFCVIKKDSLKPNEPSEDFYATGGHKIMVDGVETKVVRVKKSKKVNLKNQLVYSISTDIREVISINNLPVMTWAYNTWINKSNYGKKKIWYNNGDCDFIPPKLDIKIFEDKNDDRHKNIIIKKKSCGDNYPDEDILVNENCKITIDGEEGIIKDIENGDTIKFDYKK